MRTIHWGIIGCGDVTEVKSGPGFQKAHHSSLVAVMRRSGELARDYAQRHGVPRWYDDAEALIHDPEVDAIYIATPPAFHNEYTLLSAQAGKPVYVEKPMALNFEECQSMIEVCRAAGVPLFVAYYRRALSRFLKVKELIDAQAIGEPRFVTMTLYQPIARYVIMATLFLTTNHASSGHSEAEMAARLGSAMWEFWYKYSNVVAVLNNLTLALIVLCAPNPTRS